MSRSCYVSIGKNYRSISENSIGKNYRSISEKLLNLEVAEKDSQSTFKLSCIQKYESDLDCTNDGDSSDNDDSDHDDWGYNDNEENEGNYDDSEDNWIASRK